MTKAAISGIIRNVLSGLILAGLIWLIHEAGRYAEMPGQVDHILHHQKMMETRQSVIEKMLIEHEAADDAARNAARP